MGLATKIDSKSESLDESVKKQILELAKNQLLSTNHRSTLVYSLFETTTLNVPNIEDSQISGCHLIHLLSSISESKKEKRGFYIPRNWESAVALLREIDNKIDKKKVFEILSAQNVTDGINLNEKKPHENSAITNVKAILLKNKTKKETILQGKKENTHPSKDTVHHENREKDIQHQDYDDV